MKTSFKKDSARGDSAKFYEKGTYSVQKEKGVYDAENTGRHQIFRNPVRTYTRQGPLSTLLSESYLVFHEQITFR